MDKLVALDVAILPPPDVARRAMEYSAALGGEDSHALRLDETHLPHVTLTQHFVREEELEIAFTHIDEVVRGRRSFLVRVGGGGKSGHTVWMALDPSSELTELHEALMEALRGIERPGGTPAAFVDEARAGDALWVAGFRLKSSFGSFTPHITLGHGAEPPSIPPFTFEVRTIAACHLGRFCSCRHVLREWTLDSASGAPLRGA
jgi:2'-5' RNA ligase